MLALADGLFRQDGIIRITMPRFAQLLKVDVETARRRVRLAERAQLIVPSARNMGGRGRANSWCLGPAFLNLAKAIIANDQVELPELTETANLGEPKGCENPGAGAVANPDTPHAKPPRERRKSPTLARGSKTTSTPTTPTKRAGDEAAEALDPLETEIRSELLSLVEHRNPQELIRLAGDLPTLAYAVHTAQRGTNPAGLATQLLRSGSATPSDLEESQRWIDFRKRVIERQRTRDKNSAILGKLDEDALSDLAREVLDERRTELIRMSDVARREHRSICSARSARKVLEGGHFSEMRAWMVQHLKPVAGERHGISECETV